MSRQVSLRSTVELGLVACLCVLLPFNLPASLPAPWTPEQPLAVMQVSELVAVLLVGASLLRRRLASGPASRLSSITLGLGSLFALLTLASASWSSQPVATLERTLQVAIAIALAGSLLIGAHLRLLAISWLVGACLQGVVALLQFWLQHSLGLILLGEPQWLDAASAQAIIWVNGEQWARSSGLTAHPNQLGAYLAVALAIATGFSLRATGRRTYLSLAVLALIAAAEVVTFSRAGWLSALVAVALVVIWTLRWAPELRRRLYWILGVLASVTLAFIVAYPQLFAARTLLALAGGGWSSIAYEAKDLQDRFSSQEYALSVWANRPLLGMGAGAFGVGVCNATLWIAVELGAAGLVLWLGWVCSGLLHAWRRARDGGRDPSAVVALAALVAVALGGAWNPDLWSGASGRLMLAIAVAVPFALETRLAKGPARRSPRPMSGRIWRLLPGLGWARLATAQAAFLPFFAIAFAVAAAASQPQPLSPHDALLVASAHVTRVVGDGRIGAWRGAGVGAVEPYYDLDGSVTAYAVEVVRGGQQAGYVLVSAKPLVNPILEFSGAPAYHRQSPKALGVLSGRNLKIDCEHPLYLGALSYYCQAQNPDTGEQYLVNTVSGQVRQVFLPLGSPRAPPAIDTLTPESVGTATIGLSRYHLLSAPYYLQFPYGACYVGCTPTAAGIMMGYWSDRGYPDLVAGGSNGDYQATIVRLHELMGTFCSDGIGWTYLVRVTPALIDYTWERGYDFASRYIDLSPTYDQYLAEIDASRPLELGLANSVGDQHHPSYGNHSVTGVGYEYEPGRPSYRYMIIHDNWGTDDVWLQYGVNYDAIVFNTLAPLHKVFVPFAVRN